MKHKVIFFKLAFFAFFVFTSFLFSNLVLASDTCVCANGDSFDANASCGSNDNCNNKCIQIGQASGTCKAASTQSPVQGNSTPQTLPNPLGVTDINAFIAQLITFVLSLVGSVSLLLFVYGGITWMTSMGNATQVKKGRDIVIWAIIGLLVVFTSYILVKFVIVGITASS